MHRRTLVVVIAVALVALGLAGAALRATRSRPACADAFAERIDPNSSQHLLPGAPAPTYLSDPPTSGAHRPGLYPTGVVRAPIARAEQVTLLEQGEVLVQYRSVSAGTLAKLRAFVGKTDHVTIAPNPSLQSPIVATAWLWKMNCRSFSDSDLRAFVHAHQPVQPVSQ